MGSDRPNPRQGGALPRIDEATFLTSAADPAGWPDPGPPEIAFVGRSNVGKSSLLNVLAGRRGLARTSSTPGATRLLNFFDLALVDADGGRRALRFVDLPGFGYARVAKVERAAWLPRIEGYLGRRPCLRAVVVLFDARRVADDDGGQAEERELCRWLAGRGIAVLPVITKSDKLSKHERAPAAERLRRRLDAAPILFSATDGEGRDGLWRRLLAALA